MVRRRHCGQRTCRHQRIHAGPGRQTGLVHEAAGAGPDRIAGFVRFLIDHPLERGRPDVIGIIIASLGELGPKLDAGRGPVERIVIAHAEKPAAN